MSEHQFYKNPHYVPLEIDRMGDRLAAVYHPHRWTDTNMEYLVLRIVVRMQPRVMTSNNKTFQRAYDAHYSQYVLGGIG
jgi:hypothetical protein